MPRTCSFAQAAGIALSARQSSALCVVGPPFQGLRTSVCFNPGRRRCAPCPGLICDALSGLKMARALRQVGSFRASRARSQRSGAISLDTGQAVDPPAHVSIVDCSSDSRLTSGHPRQTDRMEGVPKRTSTDTSCLMREMTKSSATFSCGHLLNIQVMPAVWKAELDAAVFMWVTCWCLPRQDRSVRGDLRRNPGSLMPGKHLGRAVSISRHGRPLAISQNGAALPAEDSVGGFDCRTARRLRCRQNHCCPTRSASLRTCSLPPMTRQRNLTAPSCSCHSHSEQPSCLRVVAGCAGEALPSQCCWALQATSSRYWLSLTSGPKRHMAPAIGLIRGSRVGGDASDDSRAGAGTTAEVSLRNLASRRATPVPHPAPSPKQPMQQFPRRWHGRGARQRTLQDLTRWVHRGGQRQRKFAGQRVIALHRRLFGGYSSCGQGQDIQWSFLCTLSMRSIRAGLRHGVLGPTQGFDHPRRQSTLDEERLDLAQAQISTLSPFLAHDFQQYGPFAIHELSVNEAPAIAGALIICIHHGHKLRGIKPQLLRTTH